MTAPTLLLYFLRALLLLGRRGRGRRSWSEGLKTSLSEESRQDGLEVLRGIKDRAKNESVSG